MKSVANTSFKDILQRKMLYYQNNAKDAFEEMYCGYVCGFKEMLDDSNMSEDDFIKKYDGISKALRDRFETAINEGRQIDDADKLSGYNNAIVDVLCLFDEKYLYDIDN